MNGENKKKTHSLRFLVIFLIALGIHLLLLCVGIRLRGLIPNAETIYHMCTMLLTLSFVFSGCASFLYERRLKKQKVLEANQHMDEKQIRMNDNPEREWQKFLVACVLTGLYILLISALWLSVPLFYGASGLGASSNLGTLIAIYFGMGILGRFSFEKNSPNDTASLPEKDYPLLHKLVKETAGNHCRNKTVRIYVMHGIPNEECSAAVSLEGKNISLWIGAVLLCILDEDELRQVLLHEFAHLDPREISRQRIYHRIMGFLAKDSRVFFSWFLDMAFRFPASYLYYNGSLYFLLSSRNAESKADSLAASLGNKEKQASALAKIHSHEIYSFEREPYVNLFVSENIPQHLMTDRAERFRNALAEREAAWCSILEHEIPSRVATHPTFRQRWEAIGKCRYSLLPAAKDSPFAQECWRAAETADKERASISQEEYDRMRRKYYLDPLKTIAEYEVESKEHTPDELRPIMLAYFTVGMPEKMETICDKILESYDSPFATAFACYWKGVLLLYRYDKSGIDYIWKAIERNTNYIEDGISRIGSFCTRMGLQEELDNYRRRAPAFLQKKVDRSFDGITEKAKLTHAELPDGWLDEIREFILKSGGDMVERIYLVKELINNDYTPSAFILRFRENAPEDEIARIYDKVFSLLDDWPIDWEFDLYVFTPEMEKALNRVSESCIYINTSN